MRGSEDHHAVRGWPRIQDVATGLLPRFRSVQTLNTSQRTGSGTAGACPAPGCRRVSAISLTAALQDDDFEHPGIQHTEVLET